MRSYDPTSGVWTTKANMISSRRYDFASVVGPYIYAAGGTAGAAAERYDPATDTWTAIQNVHCSPGDWHQTGGGIGGVWGDQGKFFILGGYGSCGGSASYRSAMRYDVATNTWDSAAHMPNGHENCAATSSATHLYIWGGWNDRVDRYDPVTNTWASLPNTPGWFSTGGGDGVFLGGYLWAVAGSGSNKLGQLQIDSTTGNAASGATWTQMTSMNFQRGYGIQSVVMRIDSPYVSAG